MIPANNARKIIAVFGGSWPRPRHPAYQEAYQLGELLAKAGYNVLNGGYIGTMEAVSRGAFESGGQVIGFACEEIERWRGVKVNQWICEEKRYGTLRSRLMGMVDACDAALALAGGVGTLAEVSMMWNHLLTHAIPARPLILIGSGWRLIFEQFLMVMGDYVPQDQRLYIRLAQDAQQAVRLLEANFSS